MWPMNLLFMFWMTANYKGEFILKYYVVKYLDLVVML